jgi:hypothetical protein
MENKYKHPSLPLSIVDEQILGPDGVVGYVNCGDQYVYVCYFRNYLVVAESNSFDSITTRLVTSKIKEKYTYAFKILCRGGVTVVVDWIGDDIALIGITSGYLINGDRLWRGAADIPTWPGTKGVLNETGSSS